MEVESFEKFLKEHIKVENKTNNLGDLIGVSSSNDRISVAVSCAMAKRYLKYLTKKYLKKQQLRDYLRVVASGKTGYKLVYFNVSKEECCVCYKAYTTSSSSSDSRGPHPPSRRPPSALSCRSATVLATSPFSLR
ncbi:hypothetical protein BLSTO_01170 [Blastocystis sp. subtype 1]